jgi:hypothetical protein
MTSRRSTPRIVAMLAGSVLALSLAACGQSDGKTGAPSVAAASGNEATQNKFNHYTEGFNKLIDDNWGVGKQYQSYVEADVPHANASGNVYFSENITNLERALGELKEGRALNGGAQATEADAAVDKVLAQGAVLLAQWKTLAPYYESKAYREDNLAQGKAAHPALIAAYESTIEAIGQLDAALTRHLRARDAARLEAYRKSGNTAAYNLMNAMQQADLFTSAVIEKNMAESDRLLPLVIAANAELHKTEAATPADGDNKIEYDLISGYLDRMIGDYRDLKQSNDDDDREDIIDAYNNAVGQMNDVEFES